MALTLKIKLFVKYESCTSLIGDDGAGSGNVFVQNWVLDGFHIGFNF